MATITIDDVRDASVESAYALLTHLRYYNYREDTAHARMAFLDAYLTQNFTGEELRYIYAAINGYKGGFEWVDAQAFKEITYGIDADGLCYIVNDLLHDKTNRVEPVTLIRYSNGWETTTWDQVFEDCTWYSDDLAFELVDDRELTVDEVVSSELKYTAPELLEKWAPIQSVLEDWHIYGYGK